MRYLYREFDLIKELRIKDDHVGMPIEQVISELVLVSVKVEVAEKIRIMLNKATVNFGGNKNEVSREMWAGSHIKNAPQMKRIVKNKKQFQRFVASHNGKANVYTTVYDFEEFSETAKG